ncbi:hypothetical protein B7P43_G01004 [Cryptotermes secundus]|uniref:THAP-type domain-containing protein n=1 Tax=Cryptotermes secundus TaxID=105785 RepID=A0A2J7PGA5_9NEOP|nr:hypothetical protein B7P43_G01004 [Cryptotermes secundus]
MVNYCCAINCRNSKTNRPDLKFFRFPFNNSERSWEWIVNLGRVDLLSKDVYELYTSYIVCAEHFERHYFLNERRRKLGYNAVPTIFNHYSHDVDVSFILESLNRIQNKAASVVECQEQIPEPVQCSQQSSKETTSLAASSQCTAPKSYKCQQCNEIFLSVHQLFSHELRDHEHVGISQIGHNKKPLPKYNQHEKVSSPKNDVHESKTHDTNPRTEACDTNNSQQQEEDLQIDASNIGIQTPSKEGKVQSQDGTQQTHTSNIEGKLQRQDGNQQTHTSNMEGKSQKQDGNQQIHTSNTEGKSCKQDGNQHTLTSNIEGKSQKQDGNRQTDTSSMKGRSQKQDGNQQIHTSNMEGKSQKQDGNQYTHTSNIEGKSQKQDGNQQTHTSNMEGNSQKQDGNQQTHTSNMEGKSQKQDGNQHTHTSNMEGKSQKQDGNQQTHTCSMERKSQRQGGNQQTYTSNMDGKSQKQDGNQHTHTSNMEGKSQKQDGIQHTHTSNVERKSQRQVGNEQTHTSSTEGIECDQNACLQYEEPFISDNQNSKSELQYNDKENAFLQQGKGHFESSFSGEETPSEVVDLAEPMTSSESEVIPLPYKCFTCEERFQTRCQLFYHDLEVHVGITKPATLKSRDISLNSPQKNLKEKITLSEGGAKRIAENTLEEQQPMKKGGVKRIAENILEELQPMKVIITEKENTGEKVNEKQEKSESRQVSFKKAGAGNKSAQKYIVKQNIEQGDGKKIKINTESLEQIKETIQAITAKYAQNKTLSDTGGGSEVHEQDADIQPKTFVIVKDDSQRGKGNQKTTGGYRIDVVTNYVLSQSQVKQLLQE